MKIYVNGCSHSKCHLEIGTVSWPLLVNLFIENEYEKIDSELTLLKKSLIKKDESLTTYSKSKYVYDEYYRNVFINFVKDKNKYFISEATDAKGNDSILYETMESLRYLKRFDKLPDICLIQWSGHSRNLMTPILKEHSHLILPSEYVEEIKPKYFTNYRYCTPQNEFGNSQLLLEPSASFRTVNHMVILQEYLKSLNIRYVFVNYFPLDSKIIELPIFKELDLDRFVSFDDSSHPLFDGWLNNIIESKFNLNKDPQGHPNINGMKLLSLRVLNKISKNKIYSETEILDLINQNLI